MRQRGSQVVNDLASIRDNGEQCCDDRQSHESSHPPALPFGLGELRVETFSIFIKLQDCDDVAGIGVPDWGIHLKLSHATEPVGFVLFMMTIIKFSRDRAAPCLLELCCWGEYSADQLFVTAID